MKKVYTLLFAFTALLTVSCDKEQKTLVDVQAPEENQVYKTFNVSMPYDEATKTFLHTDGHAVYWSADDEIAVIDRDNKKQYTFTLKSGEGTADAVFEGTIDADASDNLCALYPNVTIDTGSLPGTIRTNTNVSNEQTAVANGFDKRYAFMTAKVDGSGNFAFRHGAAYFKLTVGSDNVKSIDIQTSTSKFFGKAKYDADSGTPSSIDGTTVDNVILSGSITKGTTYYIPVLFRNSNLGTITVKYTFTDDTFNSKSTTSLSSKKVEAGKIYNFGTLAIDPVPSISVTASDVHIAQASSGGTIHFSILNPAADGNMAITETSGKTNPSGFGISSIGADDFVVTFGAANGSEEKKAYVTLKYSYDGDTKEIEKDIIIYHSGDAVSKTWDFSDGTWETQLTAVVTKNTSGAFTLTVDGLKFTSTSSKKSKWNKSGDIVYIQTGGSGDTSNRVFEYDAPCSGELNVWAASTSSGADDTRKINVKLGTADADSKVGGYASSTQVGFDIEDSGHVYIYSTNNLNIYKITFDSY